MLRTYSRAFAAVRASADNVEGSYYMEHILFKRIRARLGVYSRIMVIKYAGLAGACRAYVSADVAAYAA